MREIIEPTTTAQLDQVRALMTTFVAWSRQRYAAYLDQVNAYFEAKAFAAELAGLPGAYAPPRGRLLLAYVDAEPAGCVAFRPFDEHACEMKRMFVDPVFHGRGVGRALAERLIAEARNAGVPAHAARYGISASGSAESVPQPGFCRYRTVLPGVRKRPCDGIIHGASAMMCCQPGTPAAR